jgi:hypothetical protein
LLWDEVDKINNLCTSWDNWDTPLNAVRATAEEKKGFKTRLLIREIQEQQAGTECHYAFLAYFYMIQDDIIYPLIESNALEISIIRISSIENNQNDDDEHKHEHKDSDDNNSNLPLANAVLKLTYQGSSFYWGVQHSYFSDDENGLKYVQGYAISTSSYNSLGSVGNVENNETFRLIDITDHYSFKPIRNEQLINMMQDDTSYQHSLLLPMDQPENTCAAIFRCCCPCC